MACFQVLLIRRFPDCATKTAKLPRPRSIPVHNNEKRRMRQCSVEKPPGTLCLVWCKGWNRFRTVPPESLFPEQSRAGADDDIAQNTKEKASLPVNVLPGLASTSGIGNHLINCSCCIKNYRTMPVSPGSTAKKGLVHYASSNTAIDIVLVAINAAVSIYPTTLFHLPKHMIQDFSSPDR